MDHLKKLIREIPDYPKPGILFYDVTTLLKDKKGFHTLIDELCEHYDGHQIDIVTGVEARGFIFGPALAYRLGAGFVPVRKPKKLPSKTVSVSYALEYGTTRTPSSPASACSCAMTCWPRVARHPRRSSWCANSAGKWKAQRLPSN